MELATAGRRLTGGFIAVLLVLAGAMPPAGAQPTAGGPERALALRDNVVAIRATWADRAVREGFGFITGTRGNEVYIATANHVLRGDNPGQIPERVELRLRQLPGRSYPGEVLETHEPGIDLAVLAARLPAELEWRRDALAPEPAGLPFGAPVWFIGRDREWYVPANPGAVNRVSRLRYEIVVDDLGVRVGSSGAPLVAADGIVGMVVRDAAADTASATLITAIELAFREWGLPWDLGPVSEAAEHSAAASPERPSSAGTGWSGATSSGVVRDAGVIEVSGAYPEPGSVFRDCAECPEMVVVPGGTFRMGSPEGEESRFDQEGPQDEVRVAPFALGRYEVTFAEWDACVAAGGCAHQPDDDGWGRGRRPVINVSWEDAQQYVAWLSRETGEAYRLPSEAEWEYAARAGTTTPFWTGATIGTDQANYDGTYTYGSGRQGEYRRQTTPVDTFAANPWGLHDMHGNVWEWTADRWHDRYEGGPTDGSAWVEGGSSGRVVRGGSWNVNPRDLRSANRYWFVPVVRYGALGFRVARALTP